MAGKKKVALAKEITADDILALYQKSLPFLPESPDLCASAINNELCRFVWYDFYFHLIDIVDEVERAETYYNDWNRKGDLSKKPIISIVTGELTFDEKIQQLYESTVSEAQTLYPNEQKVYHTYKLVSYTHPKVALVFFRYSDKKKDNSFSEAETLTFTNLSPHLFLLYRALNKCVVHSQKFQYFNLFANICSRIAKTFNLTRSETRLLPDLITGFSNEQIAERNFVAESTVKKHLKHIFQKTGSKSRIDFIGKFFTAPDRVEF
jgi:DNA-binding CsgD family transcriptional regulator